MRHLIAFATLVSVSCGSKGGDPALAERARSFCHELAAELRSAAGDYGTYATSAKGDGSGGSNVRATLDLPYGIAPRERGIASVRLHRDLQFCVQTRRGDEKALDALSGRANTEIGKLHSVDAPADVASTVDALAKVAEEIEQLPVR